MSILPSLSEALECIVFVWAVLLMGAVAIGVPAVAIWFVCQLLA